MIVQFGGQTPLNLAMRLHEAGVPIIGTSPDSIDLAEDRKRFGALLSELGFRSRKTARRHLLKRRARLLSESVIRCWCGRAMCSVAARWPSFTTTKRSNDYMRTAVDFSPDRPVLIDKFLEQAAEFDVDALADETACVVAGIQEHIEEAGIHSGDSSCVLPPVRIAAEHSRRCATTRGGSRRPCR